MTSLNRRALLARYAELMSEHGPDSAEASRFLAAAKRFLRRTGDDADVGASLAETARVLKKATASTGESQ